MASESPELFELFEGRPLKWARVASSDDNVRLQLIVDQDGVEGPLPYEMSQGFALALGIKLLAGAGDVLGEEQEGSLYRTALRNFKSEVERLHNENARLLAMVADLEKEKIK